MKRIRKFSGNPNIINKVVGSKSCLCRFRCCATHYYTIDLFYCFAFGTASFLRLMLEHWPMRFNLPLP